MTLGRTFFVRHGNYEGSGNLTSLGRKQSEIAGRTLLERGLGAQALILTSPHKRAAQTAEIIGSILGTMPMAHEAIAIAGDQPEAVKDLDQLIESTLRACGTEQGDNDLVVVTHMPLVSLLEHGNRDDPVDNGHVHEYLGRWPTHHYLRIPFGAMLDALLQTDQSKANS